MNINISMISCSVTKHYCFHCGIITIDNKAYVAFLERISDSVITYVQTKTKHQQVLSTKGMLPFAALCLILSLIMMIHHSNPCLGKVLQKGATSYMTILPPSWCLSVYSCIFTFPLQVLLHLRCSSYLSERIDFKPHILAIPKPPLCHI